jgi:hypothetical protein
MHNHLFSKPILGFSLPNTNAVVNSAREYKPLLCHVARLMNPGELVRCLFVDYLIWVHANRGLLILDLQKHESAAKKIESFLKEFREIRRDSDGQLESKKDGDDSFYIMSDKEKHRYENWTNNTDGQDELNSFCELMDELIQDNHTFNFNISANAVKSIINSMHFPLQLVNLDEIVNSHEGATAELSPLHELNPPENEVGLFNEEVNHATGPLHELNPPENEVSSLNEEVNPEEEEIENLV